MFHCSKTDGFCVPLEDTMAMVFPSGIFEGPKLEGASRVQEGPTDTHVIVERSVETASDVIPPTLDCLSLPTLSIQLPTLSQMDLAEEDNTARLDIANFERVEDILLAARQLEGLAHEEKNRLEEEASLVEADVGTVQVAREKVAQDLTLWEDNAYKKFVLLLGEKLTGRSTTTKVEEPAAPERVADPFRKRARDDCRSRLTARKKAKSPSDEVSPHAAASPRAQGVAANALPSLIMGDNVALMARKRAMKEDPTTGHADVPACSSTRAASMEYKCKKEEGDNNRIGAQKVVCADSVMDEMFSDTACVSQAHSASEGIERGETSGVDRALPGMLDEGLGTCSSLGSIVLPDDLLDSLPAGGIPGMPSSPEFD